jgi:asparagine synthase (glutamine-hydrolysing)
VRAADLSRAPSAEQQDRPYPDWLLVASPGGALEFSRAVEALTDGGGASGRPELARAGQCSALLDGVLYNRADLERRLELEDSTDSQLALQAYLRWGEDALLELKGIYAFVVGDERRERIICARDRVGSYPLFYADAGGDLMLSTSIEVLLRDFRVSGEINRAALADHLAHNWPDPGETYFSTIRRVPPGQVLVDGRDGRRIHRYWDPIPDDAAIDWVSEDELEHFDRLLDAAIARFLSLGPAGIFLSGGFDSVSVAAIAASTSRDAGMPAPWALSLGFSDQEANEQAIQRSVAADLDLPQLLVPLEEAAGTEGLLAASLELNRHWPAPVVNLWMPAYIHLAAQGRERGCRVLLTGHGGDEWLSVTPFYAADLLFALDLKGFFRLWDNQRRSYPIPPLTVLHNLLWRFGTRPLLGLAGDRIAPRVMDSRRRRRAVGGIPAWVAPDPALRQELVDRANASVSGRRNPGQIYRAEMDEALDHALVGMELEEAFEFGRHLGLRFGHPYWDADLLTFLYRTPPELLNKGGRSKGLVRGTLARRFPELGFERHRKITGTPVVRSMFTLEGELAWRRMGGATALAELGIVDKAGTSDLLGGLLNEHARKSAEKNAYAYRIWDILGLEAWARAHK